MMPPPLVPRATPKLRRDVPSLPRFDRLDRRLPYAASTSPGSSSRTTATPSVSTSLASSTAGLTSGRGRRPSHGGHQLPGHSAGNHHVRQPSPVPSSASSSGDSEREDDDAHPNRRASGLAHYGTGGADGTRWRAARKKGSRSGQAKPAASGLAAIESSSAPGGESDAFGGSLTEEAWTPAVERQPETSTSGRPGWAWAIPDFARSRRASPAVPQVELPDAATFAQLLSAHGAGEPSGAPLAEQQSPSSGSISPTVTLDGRPQGGGTPPDVANQLSQRGRHPGSASIGPSISQRSGRPAAVVSLTPVFPLSLRGGSWHWQITRTWTHSALVVAALIGASYEIWKEGVQEDRYCVFGTSRRGCVILPVSPC